MPSLLASAAMAALAGSGGRKLSTGPTACTHDICGRKLLVWDSAASASAQPHGNPKMRKQGATGYITSDFQTTEVTLDMNGHFLKAQSAFVTSARIEDGQLIVKTTSVMTDNSDSCKLEVTPTFMEGADFTGLSTQMTSVTFNPSTGHATVASKIESDVYVPPGTDTGQSGDARRGYFEVSVPNPTIDDPSLGYLGVQYEIVVECDKHMLTSTTNTGSERAPAYLTYDASGNNNHEHVTVRHKYAEKDGQELSLVPVDPAAPITVGSKALDWATDLHAERVVKIAASSVFRTEDGAVRFPTVGWDDFVEVTVSADDESTTGTNEAAHLDCVLVKGTVDSDTVSTAIKSKWYGGTTQELSADFNEGSNIACAVGETAGVSCGRQHTATIASQESPDAQNKLGFQIPLQKYYSTQPTLSCTAKNIQDGETATYSLTDTQAALSIPTDATIPAGETLGDVSKGIDVALGGLTKADDKGEAYFNTATEKNLFGENDLFTIAAKQATAWSDLTEKFDYRWALKLKNSDVAAEASASDDFVTPNPILPDTDGHREIALEGDNIAGVNTALGTRITGYEGSTIARPTLYGQTRHSYEIDLTEAGATDVKRQAEADVEFRREKDDIGLDVAAVTAGDGQVQYAGSAANAGFCSDSSKTTKEDCEESQYTWDSDNDQCSGGSATSQEECEVPYGTWSPIDFPGHDEEFKGYSASVSGTCAFCKTGVEASVKATLGQPSGDGTNGDPYIWQLYNALGSVGDNDVSLFQAATQDASTDVWTGTSSACTGSGDTHAWCLSADGSTIAYQCSDMSVTYEMDVAKDADDSRVQQDDVSITKYYSRTKPDAPDPPTIADKVDVHYRFAGAGLEPQFASLTATSSGALGTGDATLTFAKPAIGSGADAFNCNAAVDEYDVYAYTAKYAKVCNKDENHEITYNVKSQFIYTDDQVQTKEALVGLGESTKIVEHTLQHTGVDLTFEVEGAQAAFALPLSGISVDLTGDVTKTLSVVSDDTAEGCVVEGSKLKCLIKGFQLTSYDSGNKLGDDGNCVNTVTNSATEVACPSIGVSVKARFGVPKLSAADIAAGSGRLEGAFQGGAGQHCSDGTDKDDSTCTGSDLQMVDDTCAQLKSREIGTATLRPKVHGSAIIHDELIEVKAFDTSSNAMFPNKFATIAAPTGDDATKATGANGEYFTKAALTDQASNLPAIMTNLGLEITLNGRSDDDQVYLIRFKGISDADGDSKRYNAQLSTVQDGFGNFQGKDVITINGGVLSTTIKSNEQAVYYFRIDAADADGNTDDVDPCQNKFLDEMAYGANGIEFEVAEDNGANSIFHRYQLNVQCHTATETPTLAVRTSTDDSPNPFANGISWNQQDVEIVVSGSTINPTLVVQIEEGCANDAECTTLQAQTANSGFHTEAQVVQTGDKRGMATPTLHFSSGGGCADGRITAKVRDTSIIKEFDVVCPQHRFNIEVDSKDILDGQLVTPSGSFGNIFMLNMQMLGRDYGLWGEKIALRKSTGNGNLEQVVFYDATGDDLVAETIDAEEPATLYAIPEKAQADLATVQKLFTGDDVNLYYQQAKPVLFKIEPGTRNDGDGAVTKIRCNTIELELSSYTVKTGTQLSVPKQFKFLVKCPRQSSADAATDSLSLDYGINTFTYSQEFMDIELDQDPDITGLSSTAGLGSCAADKSLTLETECELKNPNAPGEINEFTGGETGLLKLASCGGSVNWGTSGADDQIIRASAMVARRYVYTGGDTTFGDSVFCGETGLDISIVKSHDRYIAISVTQADDMSFDVQVTELKWTGFMDGVCSDAQYTTYTDCDMNNEQWTGACPNQNEYRLEAEVQMKRKLGDDGAWLGGAEESAVSYAGDPSNIESYFRDGPNKGDGSEYFDFYKHNNLADDLGRTEDSGHTMVMHGVCAKVDDAAFDASEKTITFNMKVETESGDVHYSAASVSIQLAAPELADVTLTFDSDDTTSSVNCADSGGAIPTGDCEQQEVVEGETIYNLPATYNVRMTVGVTSTEDTAFHHTFFDPTIKKGDDDKCGLFKDLIVGDKDHTNTELQAVDCDSAIYDASTADPDTVCQAKCGLVSGLTASEFGANIGTGNLVALVGPADDIEGDSQPHRVVTLAVKELAGASNVAVGWRIEREATPLSRRLRAVQHVAYTLGADGSVSKSTSFGVLPAVRDSDGVSAVTTKEQITDQKLAANGTADGDATVIERTTVEQEKTGEDHTLAVLGIVFGGIGSVAAIAVAFFVGCASRKDARGAGSSFSTVAGGFSDRQPLFNRNRFAPSDF